MPDLDKTQERDKPGIYAASPRVEKCIDDVMARFPNTGTAAQVRYFEEVHQHLAPLARQLEAELAEAKAAARSLPPLQVEEGIDTAELLAQMRRARNLINDGHFGAAYNCLQSAIDEPPRQVAPETAEGLTRGYKSGTAVADFHGAKVTLRYETMADADRALEVIAAVIDNRLAQQGAQP